MNLRFFVTSVGALILAWLALTFFREVPMESYLRPSPSSAISTEEESQESIIGEKDPDQVAAHGDVAGK
ncbi:MAG: hypothetical protein CMN04_05045 [Roseibacillus sp.]|nr:hypothetical protein [Roseibacillus sp.]|tara:strand:+ start:13283 stop:13489 length:207 start_codon:yes stop_codon:yes gene_type:complete